jgi:uncharacterized protein (DUF58 family)
VEVAEWTDEGYEVIAFLLLLPGRARLRVRSQQILRERGRHSWRGLAVATSFPFGFARKIRLFPDPGSRIVWPGADPQDRRHGLEAGSRFGELAPVSGELEAIPPWGDISRVHWPSSAKSTELLARPVRSAEAREVILRWESPGDSLEREIRSAAGRLWSGGSSLVLVHGGQRARVSGLARSMDSLALLPKAGT